MQETKGTFQSLNQEDPLVEEMATHSCILAWKIPWTEEPGGRQSMGSERVGHDWARAHICTGYLKLHFRVPICCRKAWVMGREMRKAGQPWPRGPGCSRSPGRYILQHHLYAGQWGPGLGSWHCSWGKKQILRVLGRKIWMNLVIDEKGPRQREKLMRSFTSGLFSKSLIWLTNTSVHAEIFIGSYYVLGFPDGSVVKNLPAHAGDAGLIPRLGRSTEVGNGKLVPAFLPGKSHGQRSLACCRSWGRRIYWARTHFVLGNSISHWRQKDDSTIRWQTGNMYK